MKTKKSSNHQNGHGAAPDLAAKATAAQKIADVARKHMKMLKAEFKLARKTYKQAKKSAKQACKEAKAGAKVLKAKNGKSHHRKVKAVRRRAVTPAKAANARLRQPSAPVLVHEHPAPASVSVALG